MLAADPLKFLFVINPISGGKSKNNWETEIINYFKPKHHAIELCLLTGKNDADSIAGMIQNFKPDRVIAVGGDGTVNLVARLIMGTGMSMGILPAGSANGLAKELKVPNVPEEALKIVEKGRVNKIDSLKINDQFISLHLADIGLNAQLIRYFEEDKWRGMLGYAKVVLKTMWRTQKVKVLIETDTETLSRRAYMVVLANSKRYGTGAVINPIGKINDGKFELIVVRRLAFSELLKMIFRHKPYDPRKVEIFRTRTVNLKSNRKTYFQSDGEYLGKKDFVHAEIIEGKISVLVPWEENDNTTLQSGDGDLQTQA